MFSGIPDLADLGKGSTKDEGASSSSQLPSLSGLANLSLESNGPGLSLSEIAATASASSAVAASA